MLEVGTGIISGIISGTGMGGGTILILVLSMFMGIEQHMAQATNIIYFVPTSITAIFMNIKNKLINWKIAVTIVIIGILGAVIGAKIAINLETSSLKRCFGIFLGIVAIYEIYSLIKEYKDKRKRDNK